MFLKILESYGVVASLADKHALDKEVLTSLIIRII